MTKFATQFPVKDNVIYLNHAGVSPLPKRAKDNIISVTESICEHGVFNQNVRIDFYKKARENGSKILNCGIDEIAFIRSTTHGIILCSRGIPFESGDNVIIPENEFLANVIPWLALRKKGVEVRFVKEKNNRFNVDDFYKLIDKRTKAISVSFVEFSTGFRNNVKKLGELCHDKGIIFVVDGIQATGIIPFNIGELGVDFMSMDSHKWLLGPEGIGYFYANKNAIDKIDNIFEGWLSMENFMDFLNYDQPMKKSASRFEEGSPNFIGVAGLAGSTDLLLEAGIQNIYNHVQKLINNFSNDIVKKGYSIISPRDHEDEKSGILCFKKPGMESEIIHKKLTENNVFSVLRNGAIRVSPHLYNTDEELLKVVDLLP